MISSIVKKCVINDYNVLIALLSNYFCQDSTISHKENIHNSKILNI